MIDDPHPAPNGPLERLERAARRVPFTLSTLGMLALAGWLTRTAQGVELGSRAIARLGFAPADTGSGDVVRAFMSAFVTNSPVAFWTAALAIAALAGLVEVRAGSSRAAIVFWGTHLVTLVLSWAMLAPLHVAGSTTASLLFLARDVGPSAGFAGCLGYLIAGLKPRARVLALAGGVIALAAALALALPGVGSDPAGVSAALTHLLALPAGAGLAVLIPGPRHPNVAASA